MSKTLTAEQAAQDYADKKGFLDAQPEYELTYDAFLAGMKYAQQATTPAGEGEALKALRNLLKFPNTSWAAEEAKAVISKATTPAGTAADRDDWKNKFQAQFSNEQWEQCGLEEVMNWMDANIISPLQSGGK